MNSALVQQHDELLANQPEGTAHDAAACPICSGTFSGDQASEGGVMSTYTEEELATRISDAVAPFEARIRELETSHEEAALAEKIGEATAPLQAQVEDLQSQLDAAVLEAETAKTEYASLTGYLEAAVADETAARELAARKEERLTRVRETAAFPDAHLEANADRWAAMDEAAFQSSLEDWKQISTKTPQDLANVPVDTAMNGTAATVTGDDGKSLLRETFDMIVRGVDPRKV